MQYMAECQLAFQIKFYQRASERFGRPLYRYSLHFVYDLLLYIIYYEEFTV